MKQIAEALVECGYAKAYQGELGHYFLDTGDYQFDILIREKCDPFADTLEGRRQADALEDWLRTFRPLQPGKVQPDDLWHLSETKVGASGARSISHHQWRLDRIKWCFEQMEKQD